MDEPVQEWIQKAEEDYETCLTLRRTRRKVFHNAVCFHAQQCAEKYLKAVLEEKHVEPRKIHALPVLLDDCVKYHPLLSALRPDIVKLSIYAVEFRYPGESAVSEDAKEALRIIKKARKQFRSSLGLR